MTTFGGMNLESVGRRIARRREALGLSQEDLAAKVRSDWPTFQRTELSKLENDERPQFNESVERLRAIARALQISIDELVGEN